jgi:hypothetical protein
MQENHEVFLGQKESVARYNLDAKETVWSTKVIGTPTLISTFKGYLIIQGLNKWGTKYIVHCLNTSSGNLLWYTEEFKNIIVPHFIADDMFFLDQKWQICKVSLTKGQVYFREKFAGAFRKYAFHLAVSGEDVYLISKSETLLVDKSKGSTSKIKGMSDFAKGKISAVCGNNLDQISNISSRIAAAAQSGGFVAPINGGGDGGGGGGDGG